MINWMSEVDDAACPVDDMKTTDCFVQRGWSKGTENKGLGYELTVYLGESPQCSRCKAVETHEERCRCR
jgi:hypothetical protein